ncbi:MAG: glycosyltransferase family 2 protein [Gammaproteobacteria bacterium]|jgi:dolichol-phosphate mannosyltransferase
MRFSIVVPVLNEAGNVRPLLAEIDRAMADRGAYEIIYVDDGSDDGTGCELHEARDSHPALRVLRHARRSGQSGALLSGVRAARAPWILTLDGDGQNNPADIPLLIERLAERGDGDEPCLLIGHRLHRRDGALRYWSSRIANAVRARLLRDGTPDTGCGLKLFPREQFLALPAFDHMHRFIPALMQRQGVPVESIAVGHRRRLRGTSKYGLHNRLWVGLIDMVGVMWLQRRRLDGVLPRDGLLARCGDLLGVYWLRCRPCGVSPEEER